MNEDERATVLITKANGDRVPFDPKKLEQSMRRAGANQSQITEIVDQIQTELVEGLKTQKIYRKAFDLLRVKSKGIAARYKIKKALFELGPAGYAFEKFLAEVYRNQGYEARTNLYLNGKCIQHEMDVVVENDDEIQYIECKFHNSAGAKTDVRTPLYLKSRFDDIQAGNKSAKLHRSVLVTNTRFTQDAIKYGMCVGIVMISWDHPEVGNLKDLVEKSGLHPITSLSSLNSKQKKLLIDQGILLCRDLEKHEGALMNIGLSANKIKTMHREVQLLMQAG
ncbi:MAG TPA: ATPase [Flavobacteriales bacterium]|nr:ATPase [Flavobacteriales bacterium]